jgi:hypothetical protein
MDINVGRSNGHTEKRTHSLSSKASSVSSSKLPSILVNPSSFNGHLHGALISSQVSPAFSSSSSSMSALQALKPGNAAHSTSSLLAALCQQQSEAIETNHITNNHISNESTSSDDVGNAIETKSGNRPFKESYPTENSNPKAMNGSIVESSISSLKTLLPNHSRFSLNPSEVAAVKILVSGYRESAAFLLRSADELEQLLHRQLP